MKLKDLSVADLNILAKKINRNSEHLRKIALGSRPCPANLALKIEEAMNGMITKEDLVWPKH